jgi:hypothetical protein
MLVDFKAGGQRGETGTVTLTSTSNRGIATLDVEFKVKIDGWFVDHPSGGGHINGQKCGDPPGDWIVTGTYDLGGMKGTQRWVFTIRPDGRTGTFTYEQDAQGRPGGSPVTIFTRGRAGGDVTLAFGNDGTARMHLVETSHTFASWTEGNLGKGASQNVPVQESDEVWEPGGTC